MSGGTPELRCPNCGKNDIQPKGVVAAFYPRRITDESDRHRGRKVIESKFCCRECGHEFSHTEEQYF
jgi:hypothetical protein